MQENPDEDPFAGAMFGYSPETVAKGFCFLLSFASDDDRFQDASRKFIAAFVGDPLRKKCNKENALDIARQANLFLQNVSSHSDFERNLKKLHAWLAERPYFLLHLLTEPIKTYMGEPGQGDEPDFPEKPVLPRLKP